MKLTKYILQLLQDNDMVIIPGFGAFIQEYRPAELSDDSEEIRPPSKILTFNPKIRNNDGLLVGHVAENSRGTNFETLQRIEKERDNWLYKLDKGETLELKGIGVLRYNAKNVIEFFSEEDKDLSLDSFGLEATSLNLQEEPEVTPEPVIESEIVTEETEQKAEDFVETLPEVQQEETKPEKEEIKEEVQEEIPESVPSPVQPEPEEEKKRKAGWLWLLAIIPLVGVSLFILFKDKKPAEPVQKYPAVQTVPKEEVHSPVADTLQPDTVIIPEADIVSTDSPAVEKPVQVDSTGTGYYLVGGSFKAEENAETFLQQLKADGWEPFHMGMYGNFYIVGIGKYATESEALQARDEYLEKSPGSGVWVLKR